MWQLFLFDQMQCRALGTVECVECHACKINKLGKYQNADASRWKQTRCAFLPEAIFTILFVPTSRASCAVCIN